MAFNQNGAIIKSYFTTNTTNPANPGGNSALPNADGRYLQDFTSLINVVQSKFGNDWSANMTMCQTFFLQKELLEGTAGSYEVYISYIDGAGNTFTIETTPSQSPIILPWRSNLTTFTPQSLYLNGNSASTLSAYQLVQGQYSNYTVYLKPIGTPTTLQVPVTIFIYINANIATIPGQEKLANLPKYYLEGFSINNSLYPSSVSQVIPIVLPPWLSRPYWVQNIVAVENDPILSYLPSLGGWPIKTAPLKAQFRQNNQALLATDGSQPIGRPSCLIQIEISSLDVAYVGNQSTGQILTTFIFSPEINSDTYNYEPSFYQGTRQAATNFRGQSNIQYSVTDRFGKPFTSMFATYDITTNVLLEIKRTP